MKIIEILGFIGGVLFACACIPMAWKSFKQKHSRDVPVFSMWLFLFACIFYFGWLFVEFGFHISFMIGVIETICWLIVIRYKYFPHITESEANDK